MSRTSIGGNVSSEHEEGEVGGVIAAYWAATKRRDELAREADELAERFGRLAHGLATHPERVIIGVPDQRVEDPGEWEIVASHPLPSIEHLTTLTNDIRAANARVAALRERLILMGHAEIVEQPYGFFR